MRPDPPIPLAKPTMSHLTEYCAGLIDQLVDLPEGLGTTYAVVVERGGHVLAERYNGVLPLSAKAVSADVPLLSWSMAKSITHLLIGMAHDDGLLDIEAPAPVAAWHRTSTDPRSAITLRHLLQMTSGLHWNEAYTVDAPSNVVEMLFGTGHHDVAAYAASMQLSSQPGTTWLYSSGSTNIVCRVLADALAHTNLTTVQYLNDRLLVPLGIQPVSSAQVKVDAAGTLIGSSFVYLRGLEWARIGRAMLNNGVVNGKQVIAPRWVSEARTPIGVPTAEQYGYANHWWLWPKGSATPDAFAAFGYEGQHLIMVPSKDLVVVRLGSTPDDKNPFIRSMLHRLIESI
jgi:CubicO group peptidase (beta-lactamase class C family)